jgi:hypothetical protein
MPRVDFKHGRIMAGMQSVGCGVVVLHDQARELLRLLGVLEDRGCVLVTAAPNQWLNLPVLEPIAGPLDEANAEGR